MVFALNFCLKRRKKRFKIIFLLILMSSLYQDISNNNIVNIPISFAFLTSLVRLNLACNQLRNLPAEISAMKSKGI